jgi:hypothetical protein
MSPAPFGEERSLALRPKRVRDRLTRRVQLGLDRNEERRAEAVVLHHAPDAREVGLADGVDRRAEG